MKKDIGERWSEGLRSGEYEQTQEILVRLHGDLRSYCCLGVLCDLARKDGVCRACDFQNEGSLPEVVQSWAGMASDCGLYKDGPLGWPGSLAADNDVRGLNFKQIADIIEKKINVL